MSPHLVGRVFFALSAVGVAGLRDVHHDTYRKATRAGENPRLKHTRIEKPSNHQASLLPTIWPEFFYWLPWSKCCAPNEPSTPRFRTQSDTKAKSRGRWADKVGVNRTFSHCSKCGNDLEGKVKGMLICCPLAGMFQATRIAAHHLGNPKHRAALMRPKCVVVNISVPRCFIQVCCEHLQTSSSASLCTERDLYVASFPGYWRLMLLCFSTRLSICAYFCHAPDLAQHISLHTWMFSCTPHCGNLMHGITKCNYISGLSRLSLRYLCL